ncbi:M16 family metallopeptidase [Celeribacter indicus]|uniref:Peptidase M16 domain-containing protein n=1 Tax=Celeribacter indicus TaxID=1208324 RepID=A0A0B5DNN1_9RHOB|nr:pitrilysin family protein [Celeribacter indicus]AJE45163.1 peptidase M16 domain-containing protein [Celeribacter indicus]SDX26075.1 zinc protease [Celeribacter indicus]
MKYGLTAALIALAPPAAIAADVSHFTLDNGMEVVVLEDHRAPVVAHTVWYKVGAADEPLGKSGIAHFLEHLMFKGTDDLTAGQLSRTVTRNGGSDNAFTSWDYTAYYQRIAADRLGLMMEMEADRMRDLQMTEEDVATERNVVLEERNQRTDNDPGALFTEQRRAAQYLNHPYGIPIIGWRREMEQLNRDDAFAFYHRYYAPNNAILVVAGDVDPEEVHALAQTYYGPVEPTPGLGERLRPQEPPQLAERRLEMTDPRVAQPRLARSYLVPERDPGDQRKAAAFEILAQLLGGNSTTSYLARTLAFADPKAIYVGVYYNGTSIDDGTFELVMVPTPDTSPEEAEAALDAALAQFMEEGPDLEEFERIKTQIRAGRIYAEDNIERLARQYGAELAVGLSLEDIEAWPDILQAVTPEEVIAAAEEVFNRRHSVTGWLMPEAEEGAEG